MDNKMKSQLGNIMNNGYNPYKKQLDESRKLVDKWQSTGLLEGMNGETETSGMAVLLENQARQLIDESSHTGTSSNSEEETTDSCIWSSGGSLFIIIIYFSYSKLNR